jgi:hypothetical protein
MIWTGGNCCCLRGRGSSDRRSGRRDALPVALPAWLARHQVIDAREDPGGSGVPILGQRSRRDPGTREQGGRAEAVAKITLLRGGTEDQLAAASRVVRERTPRRWVGAKRRRLRGRRRRSSSRSIANGCTRMTRVTGASWSREMCVQPVIFDLISRRRHRWWIPRCRVFASAGQPGSQEHHRFAGGLAGAAKIQITRGALRQRDR